MESDVICVTQDAGGMMLDQAAVAMVEGVTVDQFSNTTLDFAWNGTQKGFDTQAAARRAFLGVLAGVCCRAASWIDRSVDLIVAELFADTVLENLALDDTSKHAI